jgi:hypothetical protein
MRIMNMVLLVVGLVVTTACQRPATIVTPEGKIAYSADMVAVRVNRLQAVAIEAEKTGGLPTATTRIVVEYAVSANKTLQATPAGWQATVVAGWAQAKGKLPAITNLGVQAAVDAVDVVLAALATN